MMGPKFFNLNASANFPFTWSSSSFEFDISIKLSTNTGIVIFVALLIKRYKLGSVHHRLNPISSRQCPSLSYQSLLLCFSPYRSHWSLFT